MAGSLTAKSSCLELSERTSAIILLFGSETSPLPKPVIDFIIVYYLIFLIILWVVGTFSSLEELPNAKSLQRYDNRVCLANFFAIHSAKLFTEVLCPLKMCFAYDL
jgi:hypothetical protein